MRSTERSKIFILVCTLLGSATLGQPGRLSDRNGIGDRAEALPLAARRQPRKERAMTQKPRHPSARSRPGPSRRVPPYSPPRSKKSLLGQLPRHPPPGSAGASARELRASQTKPAASPQQDEGQVAMAIDR